MKKILVITLVLFSFALASGVYAQGGSRQDTAVAAEEIAKATSGTFTGEVVKIDAEANSGGVQDREVRSERGHARLCKDGWRVQRSQEAETRRQGRGELDQRGRDRLYPQAHEAVALTPMGGTRFRFRGPVPSHRPKM